MKDKKRLIDANALLERMNVVTADDTCPLHIAAEIDQEIALAPTVDAVEVVHGRWMMKETCGRNTEKLHCSVCDRSPRSLCCEDYCPNCGAKMDG